MKKIVFVLFVTFFTNIFAQKNYDIQHLYGEIIILPNKKEVRGNIKYVLTATKNTDSIVFDAYNMNILKVKTGCFSSDYYFDTNKLIVKKKFKKGKKYRIKIGYDVYPTKAMYFVGWHSNGRKQVWTQGQGKNNSHWLPTNDDRNDKFTWNLAITFDKKYQVISNGINDKNVTKNELTTHFFKQDKPASAYLIFVGAGKYTSHYFTSNSGTKVYNYQYPDRTKNDMTYFKSKAIFNFLEKEIGVNYPWKNYKQIPIKDFMYGGMENVSATSFNGNRYVVDSIDFVDKNFVNVQAHELAHQWFGDMMTGKQDKDHWLHEGFATYYGGLADEMVFGNDYHKYNVYLDDQKIIEASKNKQIPIHSKGASSLSYYQKGARVVEMLINKLGDDKFHDVIKSFLNQYKFKNASIEDFEKIVYAKSNDSLKRFFKLWLDSGNIPKIKLHQINDSIVFDINSEKIKIPFLLIYPNKITTIYKDKSFKIFNTKNLLSLVANANNEVLAKIEFKRDSTWIKNQIIRSPNFIDRLIALQQIHKWTKKDDVYKILINRDEYYPIYTEIIKQILKDNPKNKVELLKKLMQKDIKTRQYIALNLNNIPKNFKKDYLKMLNDASYVTKESVMWHYIMNFPSETDKILEKTKNIKGSNDKSLRMTWLTLALMSKTYKPENKKMFYNELTNYTSKDYNMNVRLNAFYTLQQLNLYNQKSVSNLIQSCFYFNWHLHSKTRKILNNIYQNPAYKSLIDSLVSKLDKNKRQVLQKVLGRE